jgi:hypothetical protein
MPASSHFKELLREFNEHHVRYLLVGAYAVMKYTEPRYTKDLDVWVEPTLENAGRVFTALSNFGAPMQEVGVEDFANPNLIFQIGIEPHRIDIMMDVKGLDFTRAWQNRAEAKFENVVIPVVSKSDLLMSKTAAGRPQDLIDAERLKESDEA